MDGTNALFPYGIYFPYHGPLVDLGVSCKDVFLLQALDNSAESKGFADIGRMIKKRKQGEISVKDIEDAVADISAGLTSKDALIFYINAHGCNQLSEPSALHLGREEFLLPSQLENILNNTKGAEHQLVITSGCCDYYFGSIANERRVVLTNTSGFGSIKRGIETVTEEFLQHVGKGLSYSVALDEAKYERPARSTLVYVKDESAAQYVERDTGNTCDAQPTLHAHGNNAEETLVSYAPLSKRFAVAKRNFVEGIRSSI